MRANNFLSSTAALLLALAASVNSSFIESREPSVEITNAVDLAELEIRAFANVPDGYTPKGGSCPSPRPSVRSASSLSPNETLWVKQRRNNTLGPMQDLLGRVNITGFDIKTYFSNHAKNISNLPNIAIAASGGGYRACLNGGGAIQAFDSREVNSTLPGHLGGLLQSATYLAGLSGGGWLVGSIYVDNFTTISGLLNENSNSVWGFENSIFEGPATSSLQVFSSAEYFAKIEGDVSDKSDAGFNTSITDYWGRALSYQLVNASDGGPGFTWSSIQLQDAFANGDSPMPILVSDGRAPGELLIPGNTTVYEFNPFEFGSWDPTTYGFVPLEYLGSNFSGGVLAEDEECVRGFDNVGFVMGTSSSLFNQFLLQVNSTSIPQLAKDFAAKILNAVNEDNNDIAEYQPNPFYNYPPSTSKISQARSLTLVDGGEDLQNIPFHPLIQPHRHIDVIFAIDSSADTEYNWPNGTSLVATYQRSLTSISNLANGTSFPSIPDTTTIVNLGLNTHPTFFGCNASNTTTITPLIVYIPNYPYTYASNVSTFDLSYDITQRNGIVENGYNVATMGNASANVSWPTCVGCAILSRSLERTKTPVPEVCRLCFREFCWDGGLNGTNASTPYEPSIQLGQPAGKTSGAGAVGERHASPFITAYLAVVIFLIMDL